MKKYILALAAFAVLGTGVALVAPGMVDWDAHKPEIQKRIAEATGYDIRFGGKIQLAVLPFPHVVIENVGIKVPSDTPGGEAMDFIDLKKAEVSVALAPLLRGEVSVSRVDLVDPVITMNVARDGRKLWMTDKAQGGRQQEGVEQKEKASSPSASSRFALKALEIENGTVVYNDASTGKKQKAENVNAVISADSLAGPFKVRGGLAWSGQKIEMDVQSGRMDQATKTLAVQAAVRLPDTGASLSYSGVVGTAGALDLQGETDIQTGNLSATLTALSGKPSTLPPVAFKMQGLLTAKDESADMRTMKFVFGDFQANGSLSVRNLKAKDGPIHISTTLDSASSLKLEDLMPVKSVKTVKAAANDDAPKVGGVKSFLPETLQLPMPVDVDATVKIASVSYKGGEFGDVKVGFVKKGGSIAISKDIGQMPGGGKMTAKSNLDYASGSQGASGAGVVYSDPTLTFDLQGNAKAPGKLFSIFLPDSALKSMQPVLGDPVTLSAKGRIHAKQAAIDSGSLSLGGAALNLGPSSYTLDPSGKDDVVLSVSGNGINLDSFMGRKPEANANATAGAAAPASGKPAAQTLQDNIKKLDLPVDMTLKANLTNVTMQGVTYDSIAIDSMLAGSALKIGSASLTDRQGNVMRASGSVGNIRNLSGVDVTLGGKTGDAAAFLSSFKVDTTKLPKNPGPLDLSVSLAGDKPDSLTFDATAKILGGQGMASGMLLGAMSDKPKVDKLVLHVTHPNFEQLAQKFNPSYKAGVGIRKDMDVQAAVNMTPSGYSLSGLKAVLGNMGLTGDVTMDTTGAKPDIKAVLSGDTIPLDILSGKNKTAKNTAGNPAAKTKSAPSGVSRWSRDPVNAAWMQAFNLDLKFNAKSIEYGDWTLSNAVLDVALKDGTMTIGKMDAGVYGGTMGLTATMKSTGRAGDPISFDARTNFKNVDLEPLVSSFSGARLIKARGDVSLDLDVQSSGVSPFALVSGLSGKGDVNGQKVVLEGFDLAAMSRSLVSTTKVFDNISGLVGASTNGGETAFDKVDGPFTITAGIINFDNFMMEGPAANITNRGKIDLPRWFVDMNSSIDLAQPEDAPNLDVKFQGSLDNPGNTFAGQAMQSYVQGRVNQKLQKTITDKIGDKNPELNNLLNSVLGGGGQQKPAPVPTPTPSSVPVPEQQIAPASGDVASDPILAPQDQPEAAPAPAPAPAPEPRQQLKPEEEIMKGVLEGIMGGR